MDLRLSRPVARRQLWRPRGDAVRRRLIGAEGMAAELDRHIGRSRPVALPSRRHTGK